MLGYIQKAVYKAFQDDNPEKFNKDIIFMRENEKKDINEYFKDVFASLKLNGITFLGSKTITDETKFDIPRKHKAIEKSRFDLIEAKFKLRYEEETSEVTLKLFFPKLVDDFFFQINGNRFFGIYQISDRNFYSTRKGLYLKTLLMPLGIGTKNFKFDTMAGRSFNVQELTLDFFKIRNQKADSLKNMFLYFFIKFGVYDAISFMFGGSDDSPNVFLNTEYEEYENYDCAQIRKDLFVYFRIDEYMSNEYLNMVGTLVSALNGIRKISSLEDEIYWKKKLLNTNTTSIKKADKAMFSLERVLDKRTVRNLKEIPEEDKNVFGVIRWMCYNYTRLFNIDTVNIYNRRLRLYEYMLYPLLIKFSDASYRILNSRSMDMKKLHTVFSNIGPMFIVKRLVNNELLRYNNNTSTLDLFTILRWSSRGDQSLGSSGGSIATKFRAVHPSYLQNVSLNAASAGDPGITGTLCPMSKNIHNMFFESEDHVTNYKHSHEEAFFGG